MDYATDLEVLIGGPAGSGVFATGAVAAKTLLQHGYDVFTTNEYPSTIRGGHQWVLVRAKLNGKAFSHRGTPDAILALDAHTALEHGGRLKDRGAILCDESVAQTLNMHRIVPLPLSKIIKEAGAPPVAVNMAGLGALLGMLGCDLELLLNAVKRQWEKARVAELNVKVAELGYEEGVKHGSMLSFKVRRVEAKQRLLLDGNSAVALGALAGGMSFFTAYPITPASPILHFLAEVQEECGIIVVQAECELSSINMAIGAAFAGARAVVATSGPGLSLMAEALGAAAMTETPIVIVNVQRSGPSTGLPTHTAQGDLRFAIHASHGEFPRVVLAPGDPVEAYQLSCEALNLAWKFQVPVILLTDKFLAESHWTVHELPEVELQDADFYQPEPSVKYARYKLTEDGVSPLVFPGVKGVRIYTNTNEHDEQGFVTVDPAVVKLMQEKRFRKLKELSKLSESRGVKVYGEGDTALVVWGSVKSVAMEALEKVEGVKLVQVIWLEPFPRRSLAKEIEGCKVLVAENNFTSQLVSLMRENLKLEPHAVLNKYDGRPFSPQELNEFMKANAGGFHG